jgi:hypothetical protein
MPVAGRHTDTRGLHGGNRGVTPTLARTLVEFDKLDPAQTMREERITDSGRTANCGLTLRVCKRKLGRSLSSTLYLDRTRLGPPKHAATFLVSE